MKQNYYKTQIHLSYQQFSGRLNAKLQNSPSNLGIIYRLITTQGPDVEYILHYFLRGEKRISEKTPTKQSSTIRMDQNVCHQPPSSAHPFLHF